MTRARDAIPAAGFVDPELRDVDRCVGEALANLVRRGTLLFDGASYRLTSSAARSALSAGVDDIVAYHAAFLEETIAALRALLKPKPASSVTAR